MTSLETIKRSEADSWRFDTISPAWSSKALRLIFLSFIFLISRAAADPAPEILRSTVGTADAPRLEEEVTFHSRTAQELAFRDMVFGPGRGDRRFLYLLINEPSHGELPLFVVVDPESGEIESFSRRRREGEPDVVSIGSSIATASWGLGAPISIGDGGDHIYLGGGSDIEAEFAAPPALIRFHHERRLYEDVMSLDADPLSIISHQGRLHVILANGDILKQDFITGDFFTRTTVAGGFESLSDLRHIGGQHYIAVSGSDPQTVVRFGIEDGRRQEIELEAGVQTYRIRLGDAADAIVARALQYAPDEGVRYASYRIESGRAERIDGDPDLILVDDASDFEATLDHRRIPPRVGIRRQGEEAWRWTELYFPGAFHDAIRSITASKDGRYVFTAGLPTAWISQYEISTGEFRTLGRLYNVYNLKEWDGSIWGGVYPSQILLRWDPSQPWLLTPAMRARIGERSPTPWGEKTGSNPRQVAHFRWFNQIRSRRTSGLIRDRRGTIWIGSRTPPVSHINLGVRFSGAINWYDPATETIGQIREPFIHYAMRDMANAGPDHVLGVSQAWISPYEPFPEGAPGSKITVVNVDSREVVLEFNPTGSTMTHAEEAEPGKVVIFSRASRSVSDEPHRGIFLLLDAEQMQVTKMLLSPLRLNWGEYGQSPFQRGPDGKIYFFGHDGDGTAFFRLDSRSMEITPILRHEKITEKQINNMTPPGAQFTFGEDRVYFGVRSIVSVPRDLVMGEE